MSPIKERTFARAFFLAAVFICLLPAVSALGAGELEAVLQNREAALQNQDAAPPVAAPPPALSGHSVYVFHEHLFSAEALTFLEEGKEIPGQWQQNHFAFSKLDSKAEIRLTTVAGSRGGTLIECGPLPKTSQRLTFYDVLPGNKVILYYRLEQEKQTKENNYMTFTIWAGRHRIKRLRLTPSAKDSWQKEVLDLKAASFLNKNIPMIFEIKPDSSVPLTFKFFGEIKR